MSGFHKLTINTITKETAKAISLSFDVPQALKDTFIFTAGQYVTLKTTINNKEVRRDYSLCSSPNSGIIKVAIKEVKDGTFSSYANANLKTGDTIEVAAPKGRFTFTPNNKTKNIVAFAAGSGITPVLSIVKCALEDETQSKVVLVYGNKTQEDAMFLGELKELKEKYNERLSIQFLYSQKDESNSIFGRIEKSTVNYVLNEHAKTSFDAFYICGPESMIYTVKDTLIENNVSEDAINYELFKASKTADTTETKETTSGETKITVIVDDETTTFDMSQKQTLLEAALDKDLDAPYTCQGGICSSCLARVTEGEATMRQNNILTDSEIAEGLVLTCQAHPTTPTIVIDFDDV